VALTIMALIGPGLANVILTLGLVLAVRDSRVIRSSVLSVKAHLYVEAARALGVGHVAMILRHILPNIFAAVIILSTVNIGAVILIEAALSFLGFGVPPPRPSWGGMLSGAGLVHMLRAPWLALWPGVALSLAVFGANMLGDALRDVLDPRLRGT
jgi:peptide/nickel transport system permease protein